MEIMTQHAFSNNLDHHGSKVQYLDLMDVLGQLCYPVSFDKLECLAHAFCIICSWKIKSSTTEVLCYYVVLEFTFYSITACCNKSSIKCFWHAHINCFLSPIVHTTPSYDYPLKTQGDNFAI